MAREQRRRPPQRGEAVAGAIRDGAVTAARLGAVELAAHRMLAGMLSGVHQSVRNGPGSARADAREYVEGDDLRFIDWPATARSGTVQVRNTLAEREQSVLIVLDASPSMRFGTEALTKYELGCAAASAVAELAVRFGDKVQFVRAGVGEEDWLRPCASSAQLRVATRSLVREIAPAANGARHADLAGVFGRIGRTRRSWRHVVVVSDLRGEGWQDALKALSVDRRVLVVEPFDRRELDLVAVGGTAFGTAERWVWLDTDDAELRTAFATLARKRAAERKATVQSCGATHLAVTTTTAHRGEVTRVLAAATGRVA